MDEEEEIQTAQEEVGEVEIPGGGDADVMEVAEGKESDDQEEDANGQPFSYPVNDIEWVEGWLGDAAFMVGEIFPSFRYEGKSQGSLRMLDGNISVTNVCEAEKKKCVDQCEVHPSIKSGLGKEIQETWAKHKKPVSHLSWIPVQHRQCVVSNG